MKLIVELGLAAATAVSAQLFNNLPNGLDLDVDLDIDAWQVAPRVPEPMEPLPPPKLPNNDLAPVAVNGDPLQQILALVTNISNELEELKGVAGYIKSIRANLDQGCAYTPDKEKGQCVDKCYEEPVIPTPPPTPKPRSQIDKSKICADKCINDGVCTADDQECLNQCIEKCLNFCAKEEYKCFWEIGDANGWQNDRDSCLDACFEEPAFNEWLRSETALTVIGEPIMEVEVENGLWTKEYATEWLKATCFKKICPTGDEHCFNSCGSKIYVQCKGPKRGFRCFNEDHSTSGHEGEILESRRKCVDACVDASAHMQDKLRNTGRQYQETYSAEELWEKEYFHARAINENICKEGDEVCLWKVYHTWVGLCKRCIFKDQWFNNKGQDSLSCFNQCQEDWKIRERFYTIAWQYSGIWREHVRLWSSAAAKVPFGKRGRGLWNQWHIKDNVAARCVSSNICPALIDDSNKGWSNVDFYNACIGQCALSWSRHCSRGHHQCFSEFNNFDGFNDRSACMDSCEAYTFSLRQEFKEINHKYNSWQSISLVDYIATDFDRRGYWRFNYIKNFVADRCVASNICDADNHECIEQCAWAYSGNCGNRDWQCFWNSPNPNEPNFESANQCLDKCEESNEKFRGKVFDVYTFFNTTGDLDLVPFKKITKVKITYKVREYNGESGHNRWTLKFENGVQVGDWVREMGTDPLPEQGVWTTKTHTIRIGEEVPLVWKQTTRVYENDAGEQVEEVGEWEQTQGEEGRWFATPDLAAAWAEKQGVDIAWV